MERIGIYIEREEYEAFRTLVPDDSEFARSYGEWMERNAKGDMVVTVGPDEFADYCDKTGRRPSFYALTLCAAKKANDTTKM